jgi:hypothetical protein
MSDSTLTLELHNRAQAWAVIKEQLYPFMAHWLQAGKKLVLTVKLRTRTTPQNKRYWGRGVLAQVSEQATVGGKLFSAETWHRQFKRQFIGLIELPNGDFDGMSSKTLTTAEFCLFCEQVEAFACTDLGVCFVDLPKATI